MISRMPRTAASVLLLVAPGTVSAAHAQGRVGVVTTLQGSATVARVRVPTPEPLKFRDEIFLYDRIATGDNAFARILLGGRALVTMRERSTLHLTEVPGTSTVELGAGSIGVAVVKEKMKSHESVAIRTPNAVAAIRGTVVIAEYRGDTSSFTVLRGIVDVMRLDPTTRQIIGPPVRLNPMQRLEVQGTAPLRAQPVNQEALRRIGAEYKVTPEEQASGPGAGSPGAGAGTGSIGTGSTGSGNTGSGISSGSSGRGPMPTPLPVTPLPTPAPGISGGDRSGPGTSVDSATRDSGTRGSGSSGSGSSGSGSGASGSGGRGKR